MLKGNVITARKVTQNSGQFLIGTFLIKQILTFTKYTERLIVNYDEKNMPVYNKEIQRKVEPQRVEKIADFLIDDPDALFPTNIVIAIPEAVIEDIEVEDGISKVTLDTSVFKEIEKKDGDVHLTIIDGQHRIRGIERAIERIDSEISILNTILEKSKKAEFEDKLKYLSKRLTSLKKIELIVTFFIGPTLEYQAMIFSTINRTQKSVPQSLVYELFGLTTNDSPQRTALTTVLSLNSFEESPFYERVKLHGGKYERNQNPPLTQATMVKSLIDLICVNLRESERDRFRPRKELLKQISPQLAFRRYYATNHDDVISDIMFSFYSAVRKVFVDEQGNSYWDFAEDTKATNILQTTVGYLALLDLLVDILQDLKESDPKDKVGVYEKYLAPAKKLPFKNQQRYPFTSKSRKIFYYDLSLAIWPAKTQNDERVLRLNEALKHD